MFCFLFRGRGSDVLVAHSRSGGRVQKTMPGALHLPLLAAIFERTLKQSLGIGGPVRLPLRNTVRLLLLAPHCAKGWGFRRHKVVQSDKNPSCCVPGCCPRALRDSGKGCGQPRPPRGHSPARPGVADPSRGQQLRGLHPGKCVSYSPNNLPKLDKGRLHLVRTNGAKTSQILGLSHAEVAKPLRR